ncbi:MAG: hypothetical protein QOF77_415 [Solirubrobacteraceae bacterium]|jgi:hypothetical protein|nr:hypothetical protein [Solirubrobacteraceae bacterium]
MPVGDSHLAFAEAAAADGVELVLDKAFAWLTELGHITLEDLAADPPEGATAEALGAAAEALDDIYIALGGDIDVLVSCRANLFLPVDLVHEPSGTLIELDEPHHFTSFRLTAFDRYPPEVPLGFDIEAYRERCRQGAAEFDGFARAQAGKGFGIGGIQRQRAYRDALRDLATPAMGHPPLVRIVADDGDGAAAYRRNQESLLSLLGAAR